VNDPIALLKKDHREAEALLKTLAGSAKPSVSRRSTVDKLVRALELHMKIEEQLIYPILPGVVGGEEAKEASIEHRLARDGLAEVVALQDEPGFGAAVAMLTAGVKHHVKEEEHEIFPALKGQLDRSDLAALGDAVAKEHSSRSRSKKVAATKKA
jgi:iron-sulfur cluster repair protein YtfE (RIC family)